MSEMICTCSPSGEFYAEGVRLDTQAALGVERPEDLLLAVGIGIGSVFGAEIVVDVDQWFGVGVITPGRKSCEFYIECDDPMDGLIWCWNKLLEPPPGTCENVRIERGPGTRDDRTAVVRLSAQQFLEWLDAVSIWKAHKSGCGECDTEVKWHLCAEGGRLWHAKIHAHVAIGNKWTPSRERGGWIDAYLPKEDRLAEEDDEQAGNGSTAER